MGDVEVPTDDGEVDGAVADDGICDVGFREYLRMRNGLPDLDRFSCGVADTARAAAVFMEHGFVIVPDALGTGEAAALRRACTREAHRIIVADVERHGNNYSTWEHHGKVRNRWSFGVASASRQMWHVKEWAQLVELQALSGILNVVLGEPGRDYVACGCGGDFVGSSCGPENYQALHSDLGCAPDAGRPVRPPMVTVNFVVNTEGLTWENGPLRIVPGTHWEDPERGPWYGPPGWDQEPEEYWTSTLCPITCGAAIIRDMRCWHGGTPNISHKVRYLPSVEYAPPWPEEGECLPRKVYRRKDLRVLPREVYRTLGRRGRSLCALVVESRWNGSEEERADDRVTHLPSNPVDASEV